MKIRIFTGPITTGHDIANIEQQVNDFAFTKQVKDIKQSILPGYIVITVMYD
ncbi:MAG: hypothetical protein K0R46_2015 [Herbinix sp.]|nr:hypothetical protein [Herbinix sp.]